MCLAVSDLRERWTYEWTQEDSADDRTVRFSKRAQKEERAESFLKTRSVQRDVGRFEKRLQRSAFFSKNAKTQKTIRKTNLKNGSP